MCNCDKERYDLSLYATTASLWAHLIAEKDKFVNPEYVFTKQVGSVHIIIACSHAVSLSLFLSPGHLPHHQHPQTPPMGGVFSSLRLHNVHPEGRETGGGQYNRPLPLCYCKTMQNFTLVETCNLCGLVISVFEK